MTWAGLWIAVVSGPIVRSILAIAYLAALWYRRQLRIRAGLQYAASSGGTIMSTGAIMRALRRGETRKNT